MSFYSREERQPLRLSYVFGKNEEGVSLQATLDQQTPLLLLGAPGQGKTSLVVSILRQLYTNTDAETLQVSLIDEVDQFAYLFEQQPQTAAIAVNRACDEPFLVESEALLHTYARRMEEQQNTSRAYHLLVIDEFAWMGRDPSRFFTSLIRILTLSAQEEEVRARCGVIATTAWQECIPQGIKNLFRTTIQFASPEVSDEVLGHLRQKQFFISGSLDPIVGICEAPSIRFPFKSASELFWKPIDREHFRERWNEPLR